MGPGGAAQHGRPRVHVAAAAPGAPRASAVRLRRPARAGRVGRGLPGRARDEQNRIVVDGARTPASRSRSTRASCRASAEPLQRASRRSCVACARRRPASCAPTATSPLARRGSPAPCCMPVTIPRCRGIGSSAPTGRWPRARGSGSCSTPRACRSGASASRCGSRVYRTREGARPYHEFCSRSATPRLREHFAAIIAAFCSRPSRAETREQSAAPDCGASSAGRGGAGRGGARGAGRGRIRV